MSDITLETYNNSAQDLAEYFKGIGSRVLDIDRAFGLAGKGPGEADILELGCGDGRDAHYIVPKSHTYLGLDYSAGMLELAQESVPGAVFQQVTMEDFEYPESAYDIVFAFASFLHLDKGRLQKVLGKVATALRSGGILYISNKYADQYKEELKTDEFGDRMFYFYNADMIQKIAGGVLDQVYEDRDTKGSTPWFQMALRKK